MLVILIVIIVVIVKPLPKISGALRARKQPRRFVLSCSHLICLCALSHCLQLSCLHPVIILMIVFFIALRNSLLGILIRRLTSSDPSQFFLLFCLLHGSLLSSFDVLPDC